MKTPEELAEKYRDTQANIDSFSVQKAFLAGYQAAKESNSLNNSNGWISVKDRLPEED